MATTRQTFQIRPTERALLVGKTGSGKSTLARVLLLSMPNVVIIDSKAEWDFPNARKIENPNDLNTLRRGDTRPIIYAPKPVYDDFEWYDAVFEWVYERKNTTLYIDELFAVFKLGAQNRYLQACFTRGRSRGIATIAATQRPSRIPLEVLTESDHRFMFALDWLDDKKRMAQLIGEIALKPLPKRYAFYYKYEYSETPAKAFILKR